MSIDHGFLVESASVAISLPGYRAIYTRPILIRNRSPPSVGLPAQNPSPYFFARYWLTRARIATNSGMSSALASTSFNGIGRLLPFARSQVPILRYLGCHIPCRARSPTLIFRRASTPATATSGDRGRLAPSPTGYLHVGHARTFWAAFQRAREADGTLIMRMEDLDPDRCRPVYAEAALDELRWLGIRWQEGPEKGGPFAPYVQSKRRAIYLEAWRKLLRTS